MNPGGFPDGSRGSRGPHLAQRMLVRVFLALRAESRAASGASTDAMRAEALADRILQELPGRILPLGSCALGVVAFVCCLPHVRPLLAVADSSAGDTQAVGPLVESGIRQRSEAMSDGLEALRAVVMPFTGESTEAQPVHGDAPPTVLPCPDAEARAPFIKS